MDVSAGDRPAQSVREWEGTLVAEWHDRGLNEETEEWLRYLPRLFVLLVCGVAFLVVAAWSLRPLLVLVLFGCLYLALAAWYSFKGRRGRQLKLTLDPETLTLTATSARGDETMTIDRHSTGVLTRVVQTPKAAYAREIKLSDANTDLTLIDRTVSVVTAPFGTDLGALGLDHGRVPLAVLVGSWWPDPQARRTAVIKPRFSLRGEQVGSWGQPDLAGYRSWKIRRQAREGFLLGGMVTGMLVLLVVLLPSAQASRSNAISLVGMFAFTFGALAYCVRQVWPARGNLRSVLGQTRPD